MASKIECIRCKERTDLLCRKYIQSFNDNIIGFCDSAGFTTYERIILLNTISVYCQDSIRKLRFKQ